MNRFTPFGVAALGLALLTSMLWASPAPTFDAATTPTATYTAPLTQTVTANRAANLRAGPGTTHKIVGSVKAGQQLTVVGKNPAGDWLQLDNHAWIAAFLVKPASAPEPVEGPPSTATATPTKTTPAPAPSSTPTPAPPTPTTAPAVPPVTEPVEVTVSLLILANHGQSEILAIRNNGSAAVDISAWRLDGSKGNDSCTIPVGTLLDPGASYQIATGDSAPHRPWLCLRQQTHLEQRRRDHLSAHG